ncbi:MAG: ABC transporter permease [Treponema sp.]|nr:ABC transporter permease [Treponema sp.]
MSKYSFMMSSAEKLEESVLSSFKEKVINLADDLEEKEISDLDPQYFNFVQSDLQAAEKTGYSNYSYWGSTLRMFFKNKMGITTFTILTILIAFALIQPFLPNQKSPTLIHNNPVTGIQFRNQPPLTRQGEFYFLFGTNAIGQDLWARIWSGTRTSLRIGFTVATVNVALGILIGMLWGYVRKLDFLFTELYNIINNIPNVLILIMVSFIMRPSVNTIIFAMCIYGWVGVSRLIRNLTIILRDREFNLASRCLGTGVMKTIFRNLLPHMVSIVTLNFALSIPGAIGSEVFLSIIGLGLNVTIPSLGTLLSTGRNIMMAPALRYQLIFPVIVLSIISVSFYLMGNAFADSADPRNHV